MERRNTIQRAMVLGAVRSLQNHPTADAVYAFIIKDHPAIGKGTVYRNLNVLADEGEIKKIAVPNGPDRFDHTLREHYHVQCIKCGCLSDVDMDTDPDLMKRIRDSHGIQFLDCDIMFRGICPACQKNMQTVNEKGNCFGSEQLLKKDK
jgi:Fur family ferric uptake transcriptional regulator/Fur family peroxide stress response transcriptional regulator